MNKIAFFVSSMGDTNLALKTIDILAAQQGLELEILLVSTTEAAASAVEKFQTGLPIQKNSIGDFISPSSLNKQKCSAEETQKIIDYLQQKQVAQVYIGVPSINNEIPFQVAAALTNIPCVIAYEFMFELPQEHCLRTYIKQLQQKEHITWAIPLESAKADLGLTNESTSTIGHLSIDSACTPSVMSAEKKTEIKEALQVKSGETLAFISSTTQPTIVDTTFLNQLLAELPNHPHIQLRLGLHPGIKDLDIYLKEIIRIIQPKLESILPQFKIILPESLSAKIKDPQLTTNHPEYGKIFLRQNISGAEAATAAEKIGQAVPGALLNQAAFEGKIAYYAESKSYLPAQCFANNVSGFFSQRSRENPDPITYKETVLGLTQSSAPELCAKLFTQKIKT